MTIKEVKKYFIDRCDEIISLSKIGDVWVFLCLSALIDYLTQMTTNVESTRLTYIDFINKFLSKVNIQYKDFKYQNGEQDLPTQTYVILRCGIVHKFSLIPDSKQINNNGRERSIVLAHQRSGHKHLMSYTKNGLDATVFIAEQFSEDVKAVVNLIFEEAAKDSGLESNIINYINKYPPILGGL